MSTILVTGAAGYLGSRLSERLAADHEVVALDIVDETPRGSVPQDHDNVTFVTGSFHSHEQLQQLNDYDFDVAVHYALSSGSEEGSFDHDVAGTRTLYRYLIEQGCEKFVQPSSIAAVGTQSADFTPVEVPIPDDHPCLAENPYGMSKYLNEETARYFSRGDDDLDFILFRLADVREDSELPDRYETAPREAWAWTNIGRIHVEDALRGFRMAAEADHKPGVRVMNLCGPDVYTEDTVPEILRAWYDEGTVEQWDLSHYEQPGHERDPGFTTDKVQEELGFEPEHSFSER